METVDVAIVGGGPGGTTAARAAAKQGADVVVLEKGVPRADRADLGPDSTDAAGILDYWVDLMGIPIEEIPDEIILQELDRVDFLGPTESCTLRETGIEASYPHFGYTFDRPRMDDWLRSRAEEAGAEYRVKGAVRNVESDLSGGHTHRLTLRDGTEIEAEYLVLADGPQRQVTMGVLDGFLPEGTIEETINPRTANHIAYQEHRRIPEELFEETALKFWWGVMPGETAYPWIFPNDDNIARVGLTMPIGMDIEEVEDREDYDLLRPEDERIPSGKEYIRRLLEREYGDEYDVETDFPLVEDRGKRGGTETYAISSTRPIDSPTKAGIAVVGGAMGTTSAFHEGGYHLACRTGKIAGELIGSDALGDYNDAWKDAIGNEIVRNVAFADIVAEYGPSDWDRTFSSVRTLLDEDGASGLVRKKLSSGLSGAKLLTKYKRTKRRYRKGKYAQIRESEYEY